MDNRDTELIDDSELYVELDKGLIYHVNDEPDPSNPKKQAHVEIWQRVDAAEGQFLGAGGNGKVYKEKCIWDARNSKTGQLRAVKVIQKGDESTKAHYREELKALAKFSTPRYHSLFVKSFGWYVVKNEIYINMEYLEHGDLSHHLVRKFSEHETIKIASQVVKGVGFMHRYNFIHRDLKPANLLVVHKPPENDWWVKISDFGISKRAAGGVPEYSTVNIGTREYMAPEVRLFKPRVKGAKASYTVKADIWSLGAVCAHLITGDTPFHLVDLAQYHQNQGPFTPDEELSSCGASEDCRAFIQALMARDPNHRPSAEEAAKHDWITLIRPQSSGTPRKPVNPLISKVIVSHGEPKAEPKAEFEATAQWPSSEEESAEHLTIRPRTSTQRASRPATRAPYRGMTPPGIQYYSGHNHRDTNPFKNKSRHVLDTRNHNTMTMPMYPVPISGPYGIPPNQMPIMSPGTALPMFPGPYGIAPNGMPVANPAPTLQLYPTRNYMDPGQLGAPRPPAPNHSHAHSNAPLANTGKPRRDDGQLMLREQATLLNDLRNSPTAKLPSVFVEKPLAVPHRTSKLQNQAQTVRASIIDDIKKDKKKQQQGSKARGDVPPSNREREAREMAREVARRYSEFVKKRIKLLEEQAKLHEERAERMEHGKITSDVSSASENNGSWEEEESDGDDFADDERKKQRGSLTVRYSP